MEYKYLFFLLFVNMNMNQICSIVVIPFVLSIPREDDLKFDFSIDDYFSNFYQSDLYSSIGTTPKDVRIMTRISIDNSTFIMSEKECKRESSENAQNYLIMTRNSYRYYQSTSYKNISFLNNSVTNFKKGGIISEFLSFYNTTKLKCQYMSYDHNNDKIIDTKINITDMKIILEDYEQENGCALIGIGTPYSNNNEGINFINELKRVKAINDYTFTIKYITSSDGQLIIGGLPHEYYNNSKEYKKNQYVKVNSLSSNDNQLPWSISFNKIYLEDSNKTITDIQINAKAFLIQDLKFIIGTQGFKKLIYEIYFKQLINDGICALEKTDNISNKYFFINNDRFEIFSCDSNKLKEKHKSQFPTIKFLNNDFNYIFYLSFYYLFQSIERFEKYYFLIVFPESKNVNNNWYIGHPFLRKYLFTYNYDSKAIGFYNDKITDNPDGNTNSNSKFNVRIFIEILIVVILIGLIFIAFYIGKQIEKQRKKRANELTDDNYEYFTQDNNPQNNMNIGI